MSLPIFPISAGRHCPRLLALPFALLLATPADAQTGGVEVFALTQEESALFTSVVPQAGPGSDWNHFEADLAEQRVRVLVPNDESGVASRITELLKLTQMLAPATVLASTDQIGAWHDDGTLAGCELDLFSGDPIVDPTEEQRLPVLGLIEGYDWSGNWTQLGLVYCYDQAQYEARCAQIAAIIERALDEYPLWISPVVHSGDLGLRSMWLHGAGNTCYGVLQSNGDLRVSGESQTVPDGLRHGGGLVVDGTGHTLGPTTQGGACLTTGPARTAGEYLAMAVAAGTYFVGDLTVIDDGDDGPMSSTGVPLGGVVYATGDIVVADDDLIGSVTFVSEGGIELSGSRNDLTAAVDGLLAYVVAGAQAQTLSVDGSQNTLVGALCVTGGDLWITGSENTLLGRSACARLKVVGSTNVLNDGTRP